MVTLQISLHAHWLKPIPVGDKAHNGICEAAETKLVPAVARGRSNPSDPGLVRQLEAS